MHAIEHPHLPRMGVLALGAALLAIVVLLLAASRLGGIGLSAGSASSGPAAVPARSHSAPPAAAWALNNPFASPFRVTLPWTTTSRR
jgi:hypothetical protein